MSNDDKRKCDSEWIEILQAAIPLLLLIAVISYAINSPKIGENKKQNIAIPQDYYEGHDYGSGQETYSSDRQEVHKDGYEKSDR